MITPMTLHDVLCDFLEKEIAPRFSLKTANIHGEISFKQPQIIRSGFILPKFIGEETSEMEEFPFIIPRIAKLENMRGERTSIVDIEIYIGVYDAGEYDTEGKLIDDSSGYRDFWNIVEVIRQGFATNYVIDKKYMLVEDYFEADLLDEQIYPYWEGFCKTKWYVTFPQPKPDPQNF